MEDGDSSITRSYAGKARAIFWIGSPWRLKNDVVGHEVAVKGEQRVGPEKRVKRSLPRPLSYDDFFPVHKAILVGIVNRSSEVLDKIW